MRTSGRIMAVVSQKGGVGKTTLTANLAAAFQQLRFKTLLVELDPQGSLIRIFGLDRYDLHHGLYGTLTGQGAAEDAIEQNLPEDLHLLPANVWSHDEESIYFEALRENPGSLREALEPLRPRYDYILIDGPPGLGPATVAALAAADRYLVPVQAEAMNLETLPRLQQLAEAVQRSHNPGLALDGFVVTMADTRTRHACDVILSLAQRHPDSVLQTVVPRSIRVAEESAKGRPTVLGAASTRAGRAFVSLAEEILSRHARHRDFEEGDLDAADQDDADDSLDLPEDFEALRTGSLPVSGNGGRVHAAAESEPDSEFGWTESEDFWRD